MRWLPAPSLVLPLLLLAGCESDAQKLERLQLDAATAHLEIRHWQRVLDSIRVKPDATSDLNGTEDSIRAWEQRSVLADRELDLFMNGR